MSFAFLRVLGSSLLLLSLTVPATAATLSVSADKSTYNLGETITLSFVGDAEGAADVQAFVPVLFDPGLVTWTSSAQIAMTSGGGSIPWVQAGAMPTCNFGLTPGECEAFDQIAGLIPLVPDTTFMSTLTFTAAATGIASFDFATNPGSPPLIFFGLSSAPGTSVTIVPEPSTALLVGLGLLGLARRGKKIAS